LRHQSERRTAGDDQDRAQVLPRQAAAGPAIRVTALKGDLADVKKDAKSQFSSQIDAVDTAFSTLKASVDGARRRSESAPMVGVIAQVSGLPGTSGAAIARLDGAWLTPTG
jgi:hypothetical protein